MPKIKLETKIYAPIKRCFDLSRSIDLHMISTSWSQETAIAGVTSGLIGLGETVTWRARHFGVWQTLTSKIVVCESPYKFADVMVKGAFKEFRHDHTFSEKDGQTYMEDVFDYTSPLGVLGKLADMLFLESYMRKLLEERNAVIKEYAESEKWRTLLSE